MACLLPDLAFALAAVTTDGSQPASSAMLDVKSSNRGFLLPRMTMAQRNSIVIPAEGLTVFSTDCGTAGQGTVVVCSMGQW